MMRPTLVYRDAPLCNIVRGLGKIGAALLSNTGIVAAGSPVEDFAAGANDASGAASPTRSSSGAKALSPEVAQQLTNTVQPASLRYKHVPSTRVGRASGFASLAMRIGWEKLSGSTPQGALLSEHGHQQVVDTLCRMRGAVLKLGQMLSIQDEKTVPSHVTSLFERVRDQAFAMPPKQLHRTLAKEFQREDWQEALFTSFNENPVAAASIGQVHYATLKPGVAGTDPEGPPVEVAVKVQYPGVAQSIDSDVANLKMLLSIGVLPPGMFVDNILAELRNELSAECQYALEGAKQMRYRDLVEHDPALREWFMVPKVFEDISTNQVLVSEYVRGVPIDKVATIQGVPQQLRSELAAQVMSLTLKELFQWGFMQTDPNYSNFLFDAEKNKVYLLDFGASREYPADFLANYLDVVAAAARQDRPTIVEKSIQLGFLTGREVKEMLDAHCSSVEMLGKPFRDRTKPYDFASENLPQVIQQYVPTMVKLRLRPPPTPVYSLHRRLSGTILLATKIKASMDSGAMFWDIYDGIRKP